MGLFSPREGEDDQGEKARPLHTRRGENFLLILQFLYNSFFQPTNNRWDSAGKDGWMDICRLDWEFILQALRDLDFGLVETLSRGFGMLCGG